MVRRDISEKTMFGLTIQVKGSPKAGGIVGEITRFSLPNLMIIRLGKQKRTVTWLHWLLKIHRI